MKKVFSLYVIDGEGEILMSFIIIGNFISCGVMVSYGGGVMMGMGGVGSIEYKEYFDVLVLMLVDFFILLIMVMFVFVFGDNDGWVLVFGGGVVVLLLRRGVLGLFISWVRRMFVVVN